MVTLGISGAQAEAAAALSVDGRLVAAVADGSLTRVSGVGYRAIGGLPVAAIESCLAQARMGPGDVSRVVVVNEGERQGARLRTTRPVVGDPDAPRRLSTALARAERITVSVEAAAAEFARHLGSARRCPILALNVGAVTRAGLVPAGQPMAGVDAALNGLEQVELAARSLARALGATGPSVSWSLLDRLDRYREHAPPVDARMCAALGWEPESGFAVDRRALSALVAQCRRQSPVGLASDVEHVGAQRQRQVLAAAFFSRLAELVERVAEWASGGDGPIRGTGTLFEYPSFRQRLRSLKACPLPGAGGLSLGAALMGEATEDRAEIPHLLLGPAFDETAIKGALENARLDYVYEPDWSRLLNRASGMLAAGKVVAWFQGAMEYGPSALGARSILADPSNRYARDNVNHYLLRRDLAATLPVSVFSEGAASAVGVAVDSPHGFERVDLRPGHTEWCRAAVEPVHALAVHTSRPGEGAREFHDLLVLHHRRTGVPGLINIPLRGPGEPTACTPRDALRTVYSAPVDALVIGRFLMMKDYWLLRSSLP